MTRPASWLDGVAPRRWLVTGAAGFIGSHLVEALLTAGHHVVGLDDLSTGHLRNVEQVLDSVGAEGAARFRWIEGDVSDPDVAGAAVAGVDHVLHQAALGSVPRSIEQPLRSFKANATGFAQLLVAAKDAGVRRVVYASSSSVYGDHPDLPKVEHRTGKVLSPYAATTAIDEVLADAFTASYPLECVGLRYFNVFGPRQDPDGAYAAVIPRWAASILRGETVWINGDGETSRDFCYVANVVQANLKSALCGALPRPHEVFNVACGGRTSINELAGAIHAALQRHAGRVMPLRVEHRDFRAGDVRHSQADIGKAQRILGYEPTHDIHAGLDEAMAWYAASLGLRPGA